MRRGGGFECRRGSCCLGVEVVKFSHNSQFTGHTLTHLALITLSLSLALFITIQNAEKGACSLSGRVYIDSGAFVSGTSPRMFCVRALASFRRRDAQ